MTQSGHPLNFLPALYAGNTRWAKLRYRSFQLMQVDQRLGQSWNHVSSSIKMVGDHKWINKPIGSLGERNGSSA
jgi:hypothetical protein